MHRYRSKKVIRLEEVARLRCGMSTRGKQKPTTMSIFKSRKSRKWVFIRNT